MSGSRTRTGCYSCRLRKKKCDEGRPLCATCVTRGVECLGYDVRPGWMARFRSWKEILESDEARRIRGAADRSYKFQRRYNAKSGGGSSQWVVRGKGGGDDDYFDNHQDWTVATTRGTSKQHNIYWDSGAHHTDGSPFDSSPNGALAYITTIFPLQYGFYLPSRPLLSPDCAFLFQAFLANRPFSDASACLSLCLAMGAAADGNTSGFCLAASPVRRLQVRAIRGLQEQVDELGERGIVVQVGGGGGKGSLGKVFAMLATMLQLISVEIFNELGGNWEVHLDAAKKLLGAVQNQLAPPARAFATSGEQGSSFDDSILDLLERTASAEERELLYLSLAAFAWSDIMAVASNGPRSGGSSSLLGLGNRSEFQYVHFLRKGVVDTTTVMGCDSRVMIAIWEINALEAWAVWQRQAGEGGEPAFREELVDRAAGIQRGVLAFLEGWEVKSEGAGEAEDEDEEDVPLRAPRWEDSVPVTTIHAYAALVYLETVVATHTSEPVVGDRLGRYALECLQRIEALPSRLLIRVCWPFAVAGCMSGDEQGQHDRFRGVVARAVAGRQLLGFAWKGLILMEETWRLRGLNRGGFWCWRRTVGSIGTRVLLV